MIFKPAIINTMSKKQHHNLFLPSLILKEARRKPKLFGNEFDCLDPPLFVVGVFSTNEQIVLKSSGSVNFVSGFKDNSRIL